MKRPIVLTLLFILLLVFYSCESTPDEIPPDLSKAEMFQLAQEAVDEERWDTALRYYHEFIERNPEDSGSTVEAEYEIAFIDYKRENYEQALDKFESLIAKYEMNSSNSLPEWPRVLAEKLVIKIEERLSDGVESPERNPENTDSTSDAPDQ